MTIFDFALSYDVATSSCSPKVHDGMYGFGEPESFL